MMGGFGLGGMLFEGMLMLGFWVLVIVGVTWLVATFARGSAAGTLRTSIAAPAAGPTALDIVKARYAKGEITQERYEEMRRDLGA